MAAIVLVVGAAGALNASEQAIESRLQGQGHTVTVVDDNSGTLVSQVDAADLAIVTKTVNSGTVTDQLKSTTTNLMNAGEDDLQTISEGGIPKMGWTDNDGTCGTAWHSIRQTVDVQTLTGDFADLDAGLSGVLNLYTASTQMTYAPPIGTSCGDSIGGGTVVAFGNANQRVIYAFDAGDLHGDGSAATARHVYFGLYDDTFTSLTANGLALFDAAVEWLTPAAPSNQPPTITSGTASPSTVTVGGVVSFTWAASDPDGTIAWWTITEGPGVTASSTTTNTPTVDTTGMSAGTYWLEAVATDDDGADSAPDRVSFSVVEVSAPVGGPVTPKVTFPVPAGAATVTFDVDLFDVDGNDLATADTVNLARAGTFSAPTPLWGAPGDLVARVQMSDDGVRWLTVASGVEPGALGVVDYEDRRFTPGRPRYMRARVETTETGAPSAWSDVVEVTPAPSSAWVRPLDDDGGDLGLDMPVKVRVDAAHTRSRIQAVDESLDGSDRRVTTSGRTLRRGSITFLADAADERASLDAVLAHDGTVLVQFFLDEDGVGEAIYVKWAGDDSVARLGSFPGPHRDVAVGWAEVPAP